jgi:drug/metabolite transporter (DMT)-like permease
MREDERRNSMDPVGFTAVVLAFSVPLALIYAWYRARKLRTEERLAAISKGVSVPIAEELPAHARSRRAAILLTAGGLGYTLTFMLLARYEPEAMEAALFGIIPIAIGIGYFIDAVLVRRELHPSA